MWTLENDFACILAKDLSMTLHIQRKMSQKVLYNVSLLAIEGMCMCMKMIIANTITTQQQQQQQQRPKSIHLENECFLTF